MKEPYKLTPGIDDYSYRMSQFTRKDYMVLYKLTSSTSLKRKLKNAVFQDKKVQRALYFDTFEEINIFYGDFDKLGFYLNVKDEIAKEILKWRLTINK